METITDANKSADSRDLSRGSCDCHTAHLSQTNSEAERLSDPERTGPQPAATKHHRNARAGGGRRSPSNSQRWHAHSAIDLACYPQLLCGCQIPFSNLCAERGPLPCPLISIFPSCLSYYHCYRLISLEGSEHLLQLEMFGNGVVGCLFHPGVRKASE